MKVTYYADDATQKAASDAIACQDAVNGWAIIHSLHRHIEAMRSSKVVNANGDECQLAGDERNQHPVVILFLDKLVNLAVRENLSRRVSDAYQACIALSRGENAEFEITPL